MTVEGVAFKGRSRHAGQVNVDSFGNGSPIYLELINGSGSRQICEEFGPSEARRIAAALFHAANDAEGKPPVKEVAA